MSWKLLSRVNGGKLWTESVNNKPKDWHHPDFKDCTHLTMHRVPPQTANTQTDRAGPHKYLSAYHQITRRMKQQNEADNFLSSVNLYVPSDSLYSLLFKKKFLNTLTIVARLGEKKKVKLLLGSHHGPSRLCKVRLNESLLFNSSGANFWLMILKTLKLNGQFLNSYRIHRVLGYLQYSLQHSRGLLVVLCWRVCKIYKKSPLLVKNTNGH